MDDGENDDGHIESKFGQVWYVALQQYFGSLGSQVRIMLDDGEHVDGHNESSLVEYGTLPCKNTSAVWGAKYESCWMIDQVPNVFVVLLPCNNTGAK